MCPMHSVRIVNKNNEHIKNKENKHDDNHILTQQPAYWKYMAITSSELIYVSVFDFKVVFKPE